MNKPGKQHDFNATRDLGKVLITGSSGFVGANFVKTLLDRGYKVRAFDITPCPHKHENLDIVVGNICDKALVSEATRDIDTIFHIAAIIELKGGRAVTQ